MLASKVILLSRVASCLFVLTFLPVRVSTDEIEKQGFADIGQALQRLVPGLFSANGIRINTENELFCQGLDDEFVRSRRY